MQSYRAMVVISTVVVPVQIYPIHPLHSFLLLELNVISARCRYTATVLVWWDAMPRIFNSSQP